MLDFSSWRQEACYVSLGSQPGKDSGTTWRACFVPLRAVAGAGSGFSSAGSGFCSGKGFLEHEQFPGDLQGFKTLTLGSSQLQLSGLHACCCRGLNSSREEAAGLGACVHPPHPHTDVKKQSLFSALPFPCLPGHSLAPLCDELVSGVRAVIKEGVRVAAISSLTVTMPVPRTTSPLTHIHTITNEWIL